MTNRRRTYRRNKPSRLDPRLFFLWVIPGSSVLFLLMFFASQDWSQPVRSHDASEPQVLTPSLDGEDSKNDKAFAVAHGALLSIEDLIKDLDRQARRFEGDRVRGVFATKPQNLLSSWDRWTETFHERIREFGEEFDIQVDDLERDAPTPVHHVYRLVMRVPFEIRRNWEDGRGIEGIPVRAGVDELLKQAHDWIEKR